MTFTSNQDYVPIGNNTEGFTADDYLSTPSYSTAMEEYAEAQELPSVINYRNTPILNQGNVGACSVFGITKAVNEADYFDGKVVLDAMNIWDNAVKEGIIPDGWNSGWSMGWALNLMKKLWYITGWYFCRTPEDIGKALMNKNICYTGTNKCNWTETRRTHKFTRQSPNMKSGHLYCLNGIDFNKKEFDHANSRGVWRGNKGHFTASFSDLEDMYSVVAIVDKKSSHIDEIATDEKDAKKVAEMRIWNGQSPDENLEKLHAVFMVMRAFRDEFDNNKALEVALKDEVVRSVNGVLTRRDFLKMVFVAGYGKTIYENSIPAIMEGLQVIKSQNALDKPIKRYHAALIVARMLRNLGKL